jgi:DNA mismatch repair protein MutL
MQTEAISQPFTEEKKEMVTTSELYKKFSQKNQAHFIEPGMKSELKHWKDFYTDAQITETIQTPVFSFQQADNEIVQLVTDIPFYQLHKTYIVAPLENGFLIVHQQHAHERILFEKYLTEIQNKQAATQQNLFPVTLDLSPQDGALLQELLPDLELLGYKIESFGKHSFIIQGVPADVLQGNEKHSVELLIEQFKHFSSELNFSRRQKLIHCMARQQSIKAGQSLTDKEMKALLSKLFTCEIPSVSPNGNPVFVEFNDDQLLKMFGK